MKFDLEELIVRNQNNLLSCESLLISDEKMLLLSMGFLTTKLDAELKFDIMISKNVFLHEVLTKVEYDVVSNVS